MTPAFLLLAALLQAAPGPLDVPKAPPEGWWPDPCASYRPPAGGIGAVEPGVVVVIYNPVIESEGGRKLADVKRWQDPDRLTREVVDTIREASGGYVRYRIAKRVEFDACPPFKSGFRYDDEGILKALRTHDWIKGDRSSYKKIFAEAGVDRDFVAKNGVTEVWLWGAPGFHWDEYAMFIPGREKRLPPTKNPWFYRPYDVPDLGRTIWVMGWNYERGLDCALESFAHRCEGTLSLAIANGVWDRARAGKDPWNTWTAAAGCGVAHVPPNGAKDYDFGASREVESACEDWLRWPACTGERVRVDGTAWGRNGAGFMKWWMGHFPRNPGRTGWGWNNWWVYIANFDADLPLK